jgi:glycosyltransferase involved in cell wall biosynthesis
MMDRETLLFISPRFLFPVDSGGKIRTTQILRGLKGGRFKIRLLSPGSPALAQQHAAELDSICDEFAFWDASQSALHNLTRLRHIVGKLPIPIATDYTADAARLVSKELARPIAVAVFDFLHAVVLAPRAIGRPTVLFTHNVEAEIFARHIGHASGPLLRQVWRNQHRKMMAFERSSLRRFDVVVAVSQRDADKFVADYGCGPPEVIPTGVDLDFFSYAPPTRDRDVVFCGSMDWLANRDAMQFMMDQVWPAIVRQVPDARMTVVGRAPPTNLIDAARQRNLAWTFTGFVDDVRPHMSGAAVSVVPLRIGGGTRLKVFESMAMGPAVVSTQVGVEGLPVVSGTHCLIADDAAAIADATVRLLRDQEERGRLSRAARVYVDENFGFAVAARVFERACLLAMERGRESPGAAAPILAT